MRSARIFLLARRRIRRPTLSSPTRPTPPQRLRPSPPPPPPTVLCRSPSYGRSRIGGAPGTSDASWRSHLSSISLQPVHSYLRASTSPPLLSPSIRLAVASTLPLFSGTNFVPGIRQLLLEGGWFWHARGGAGGMHNFSTRDMKLWGEGDSWDFVWIGWGWIRVFVFFGRFDRGSDSLRERWVFWVELRFLEGWVLEFCLLVFDVVGWVVFLSLFVFTVWWLMSGHFLFWVLVLFAAMFRVFDCA